MRKEAYPGCLASEAEEPSEVSNPSEGRAISSTSLFGRCSNQIVIEHQGEQYRLRLTRNGKLILTK